MGAHFSCRPHSRLDQGLGIEIGFNPFRGIRYPQPSQHSIVATASKTTDMMFDFDLYRFNGKGVRPSVAAAPEQASFMRSRYSIDGALVSH